MQLDDFDFELPPDRIAQFPAAARDDSRLMSLDRESGDVVTGRFPDVVDWFRSGDLLVLNDTRVIPARLLGTKESGGRAEVFLVQRAAGEEEVWNCLTKSSKPSRPGMRLFFAEGLEGEILADGTPPLQRVRFSFEGTFFEVLERIGHIPLPPYIRRQDEDLDRERYQTVFARSRGAVAAPTAGLHFTEPILEALKAKGVAIHPLTLHVGLGTFLPVRVEDIRQHRMHEERYDVPETTAAAVNEAKKDGRRVVALGTTTIRTLEHAVAQDGQLSAGEGVSDLFIYPGFRFRIADALITNFHLPRSTLLMLVAAFAGRDLVLSSYRRAVAEGFRFFSYGDCMLIH